MQWGILSAACTVLSLIVHALSEWQNAKTRAAILELKVSVLQEQKQESERLDGKLDPLCTDVAAMGARLNSIESEVGYLRSQPPRPAPGRRP